jgi:hypothetical protein
VPCSTRTVTCCFISRAGRRVADHAGAGAEVLAANPSTPTARANLATYRSVMCDYAARRRTLEVMATKCDMAPQGLLESFSAVGALVTDRSGVLSQQCQNCVRVCRRKQAFILNHHGWASLVRLLGHGVAAPIGEHDLTGA